MLLCKFGQNPSIGLQDIALERLISTFFMDSRPSKLGKGHQNLINSEPSHNNASLQVWSKSINWFTRYCIGKTNFNSFYRLVTLKIRSRSPNVINSEPPPNNALVQVWSKSIYLFRRYRVGKPNLISFHGLVTLKMRSRSPKSNQLFSPLPTMYLCKFGQNPSTGSKDITSERSYADADGIHTKNNMSPTFGWGYIIKVWIPLT